MRGVFNQPYIWGVYLQTKFAMFANFEYPYYHVLKYIGVFKAQVAVFCTVVLTQMPS